MPTGGSEVASLCCLPHEGFYRAVLAAGLLGRLFFMLFLLCPVGAYRRFRVQACGFASTVRSVLLPPRKWFRVCGL